MKIIPIKAQREGNLVTITNQDHIKFESLCAKALDFAREQVLQHSLEKFWLERKIQVCWWEKQVSSGGFFLQSGNDKKDMPPDTFRNKILMQLEPRPKRQPKPSRLKVLVYFDKRDLAGNTIPMIRKIVPQLGVIEWWRNT